MKIFNQDQQLWKKLQKGDENALREIFMLFHKKLVGRAYHLINDQEAAEEIVQDLFLSIWKKAPSIVLQGKIENYLMVAVKNRSFNYLKSRYGRLQSTELEEKHVEAVMQIHDHDLDQLQQHVDWSINQLPQKCKEIFILSRRHELSYKEISDTLAISKKTVETQMGIALKKLRQLMHQKTMNL